MDPHRRLGLVVQGQPVMHVADLLLPQGAGGIAVHRNVGIPGHFHRVAADLEHIVQGQGHGQVDVLFQGAVRRLGAAVGPAVARVDEDIPRVGRHAGLGAGGQGNLHHRDEHRHHRAARQGKGRPLPQLPDGVPARGAAGRALPAFRAMRGPVPAVPDDPHVNHPFFRVN